MRPLRFARSPEERQARARRALRRAVWYLILLGILLLFIFRPQLLLDLIPRR